MVRHVTFHIRIANRTPYRLVLRACDVVPGDTVDAKEAVEPLGDQITLQGESRINGGGSSQCRFALHDEFGADTLSTLTVAWAAQQDGDNLDLSAAVDGRESSRVTCVLPRPQPGADRYDCILEYRR